MPQLNVEIAHALHQALRSKALSTATPMKVLVEDALRVFFVVSNLRFENPEHDLFADANLADELHRMDAALLRHREMERLVERVVEAFEQSEDIRAEALRLSGEEAA